MGAAAVHVLTLCWKVLDQCYNAEENEYRNHSESCIDTLIFIDIKNPLFQQSNGVRCHYHNP